MANTLVWTSQNAANYNNWCSVTYGKSLFVAVAFSQPPNTVTNLYRVMTSSDGISWSAQLVPATNLWNSITYGNGLFVAVSVSGTQRVMTSYNGTTWTLSNAANNSLQWAAVTYGNGLFVAVCDGPTSGSSINNTGSSVMTSTNGTTWTSISTPTGSTSNQWYSIIYGDGLYVTVANKGTNRVMTSSNSKTWTLRTSANETSKWVSVTYGNGLFVAVANGCDTGYTATVYNQIMTSSDGINWTLRTAPALLQWESVTYGENLFVAVANTGTGNRVMSSSDGINWYSQTSAADEGWLSIVYGDGRFVAVGDNSTGQTKTNLVMISYYGVPNPPTNVTAIAGKNSATISYTAPSFNGGNTIISYTAVSSPGEITSTIYQSGSGTIDINGLKGDISYTFTVYATNSIGNSIASDSSNSIVTEITYSNTFSLWYYYRNLNKYNKAAQKYNLARMQYPLNFAKKNLY